MVKLITDSENTAERQRLLNSILDILSEFEVPVRCHTSGDFQKAVEYNASRIQKAELEE